jgi:hypothetical protein
MMRDRRLQKSLSNFCDDLQCGRNVSAAPKRVKPPSFSENASVVAAAAADRRCGRPVRQMWRVCVPPFEIIGLCGLALFFAALMFGAPQRPVR